MDFIIREATEKDVPEITSIFNHYIKNGTAAFLEEPVAGSVFFPWLKQQSCNNMVYAVESAGKVAGFGVLKQYYDRKVFRNTAELGYFFHPDFTGKGGGRRLLSAMEKDAKKLGIKNLLAQISSLNTKSIEFHKKNGFTECGNFKSIARKAGRDFNVVWMQKIF